MILNIMMMITYNVDSDWILLRNDNNFDQPYCTVQLFVQPVAVNMTTHFFRQTISMYSYFKVTKQPLFLQLLDTDSSFLKCIQLRGGKSDGTLCMPTVPSKIGVIWSVEQSTSGEEKMTWQLLLGHRGNISESLKALSMISQHAI